MTDVLLLLLLQATAPAAMLLLLTLTALLLGTIQRHSQQPLRRVHWAATATIPLPGASLMAAQQQGNATATFGTMRMATGENTSAVMESCKQLLGACKRALEDRYNATVEMELGSLARWGQGDSLMLQHAVSAGWRSWVIDGRCCENRGKGMLGVGVGVMRDVNGCHWRELHAGRGNW
jgi:hypothetical protein